MLDAVARANRDARWRLVQIDHGPFAHVLQVVHQAFNMIGIHRGVCSILPPVTNATLASSLLLIVIAPRSSSRNVNYPIELSREMSSQFARELTSFGELSPQRHA